MDKSSFTAKEKKRFRLKKYLKEHAFDFGFQFAVNVAFVSLVIYFCGGTRYDIGFALAVVYSIVKILYEVHIYKKEWLDVDIKDEKK